MKIVRLKSGQALSFVTGKPYEIVCDERATQFQSEMGAVSGALASGLKAEEFVVEQLNVVAFQIARPSLQPGVGDDLSALGPDRLLLCGFNLRLNQRLETRGQRRVD
jgi:hypothetical protein